MADNLIRGKQLNQGDLDQIIANYIASANLSILTGNFDKIYATNLVYNTGNQPISGNKTFSNQIIFGNENGRGGSISGSTVGLDSSLFITADGPQAKYIYLTASPASINLGEGGININNANNPLYFNGSDDIIINGTRSLVGSNISGYFSGASFFNRPTVNGSGVLLVGEAAGLPSSIVYATGNQVISGVKSFVNNTQFSGSGIFNSGISLNNINDLSLSGVNVTVSDANTIIQINNAQYTPLGNNPLSVVGSGNSYIQLNIQNKASGTAASADLVITSNAGSDSTNYLDLGINNSGYNQADYSIGSSGDGYLYIHGGNLTIGTQTTGKVIKFHVDNTTSDRQVAEISASGITSIRVNATSGIFGLDSFASGSYHGIGGGSSNFINGDAHYIGGGAINSIGSGIGGTSKSFSFIGGGCRNSVDGSLNTIVAGGRNSIVNNDTFFSRVYSFIGGGTVNTIGNSQSVIAGGVCNRVFNQASAILGGCCNFISGSASINTCFNVIVGGFANVISGTYPYGTFIGGGAQNCVIEGFGGTNTIVGGYKNVISIVSFATIGGGYFNFVTGKYGTIGGGYRNCVIESGSTIGGGGCNIASGCLSTIGGGYKNCAFGDLSTIGGGYANYAEINSATVGGGGCNCATEINSTIGGGYNNRATGYASTIGGGYKNCAFVDFSTIGGGNCNAAEKYAATIGGGRRNCALGYASTIGGGTYNRATGIYSTIGGGNRNYITAGYANIGGGCKNCAFGDFSTIGAGYCNIASGILSTIGGGKNNRAITTYANVGGGYYNRAAGFAATVGGGFRNCALGTYSNVGGGYRNSASGISSTVGGGKSNRACGIISTVGGGYDNRATGCLSTIGGGKLNCAFGDFSTIGGGWCNWTLGPYSNVGGGFRNCALGPFSTIGGGNINCAIGYSSTIGGGELNCALGGYSNVGGGYFNWATGYVSTIGGGYKNCALGDCATIGGGYRNCASGDSSTIGGGYKNCALGGCATIAGGRINKAIGGFAAIGGGISNCASGYSSTIGGGYNNRALAEYSYIIGGRCSIISAFHSGSAILGDGQRRIHNSFSEHSLTLDFDSGVYFAKPNIYGSVNFKNSGIFSLSGAVAAELPNNPLSVVGSGNTYLQLNIQNRATGTTATADLVITANNGTDSSNYINLGINNSGYNDPTFSNGSGLDGYLFVNGGSLDIGTATPNTQIEFHVGGTTAARSIATINSSGLNIVSGNLTVGGTGVLLTGQNCFILTLAHASDSTLNIGHNYFGNIFGAGTSSLASRKFPIMQNCIARKFTWTNFVGTQGSATQNATGYFINVTTSTTGILTTAINNNSSSTQQNISGYFSTPMTLREGDEVVASLGIISGGTGPITTAVRNNVNIYCYN